MYRCHYAIVVVGVDVSEPCSVMASCMVSILGVVFGQKKDVQVLQLEPCSGMSSGMLADVLAVLVVMIEDVDDVVSACRE